MVLHVKLSSAFAVTSWSRETTFVRTAARAGVNNALKANCVTVNPYSNHTMLASRTSKKPNTVIARSTLEITISRRRSYRPERATPGCFALVSGSMETVQLLREAGIDYSGAVRNAENI